MTWLYELLSQIGYHHPLHPPVIHIPLGLIIGAFIFAIVSRVFNRESFAQTSRHCIVLALMAAPVAILLGLMDWQQFYNGAWLLPIRIKMILSGVLIIMLFISWIVSRKGYRALNRRIVVYALCMATAIAIGFFGGELVYGPKKAIAVSNDSSLARQGAELFAKKCAICHNTDSTEDRVGPGLKGLFKNSLLPVSKKPVSEDSVANQLKTPFNQMPSYPDLTDEQIQSLIDYMKTL
ncbi:MAG: c-type cytochrome [Deltaproteobacteria bacterium]|nr:c-type cytochrome [Deltaproteobacteria bacterium]MBT8374372.1 c-type cytochrome [Deltaproteobacteria bacterium]NNK84329.1 c-type cytochrome [Desulfobacterales bacterium]